MPDPASDAPRTVAVAVLEKLETVHASLRELAGDQAGLRERCVGIARDLEQLRHHVIDGNGTPGLLDRVAALEVHRDHNRESLRSVVNGMDAIESKLDRMADEAAKQATRVTQAHDAQIATIAERKASDRRERMGYYVAIGVGFLGFLGSVAQAYAAALFGK